MLSFGGRASIVVVVVVVAGTGSSVVGASSAGWTPVAGRESKLTSLNEILRSCFYFFWETLGRCIQRGAGNRPIKKDT
jgi:hypothetical protein